MAACSSLAPGYDAREASESWGGGNKGSVVSLDDVTNGLINNEARGFAGTADPSASPLAGAFFQDGSDGDIRGRTENYFAKNTGRTSGSSEPAPKRRDRMLIYSGRVSVEVARAEDAARDFLATVESWGGYLQKQSGTSLTLRLPAGKFDDAFAAARAAGRVLDESRQASDVTEEFVDLGIRVDNARKSRDRLLEVLKMAEKVEDILKVEKELRRLTEEIERMEGRLKFLRDQVAMATLRVDFRSVAAPPPVKRSRKFSRFRWINRVGADAVMEGF